MDAERKTLYFAYGSNMDTEQMYFRCPEAVLEGKAKLTDFKFALDEKGYATVIPAEGHNVTGLIWSVNGKDEAALDYYEGVAKGCYKRAAVSTVLESGIPAKALVYLSLRGENLGVRVENYMPRIRAAAEKYGFGETYCRMLRRIELGEINEDI